MERTKANIESLMTEMEGALVAEQVPSYSLRRRWTKTESIWSQYVELYDLLCSATHEDPVEQDRVDFNNFQERYTDVHKHVSDVLDTQRSEEEARLKTIASKQKVDQFTVNGWW